MSIFLVLLIFVFFIVLIYFVFGKPYRQWEEFILSSDYTKQDETDEELKASFNNIFGSIDVLDVYKKEEGNGSVSWITELDFGSGDDPSFPYLVLSMRNAHFPPMVLSNYRYPESKTPKIIRSAFEKTATMGNTFAKVNSLKLLSNVSDSLGLLTFMIMGRNENDINFIPEDIREVIANWPPKKLDHIIFNDSFVVIKPSASRKLTDWKLHLEAKERLLAVMEEI
ncbi:hypothetical protein [uncultured Methanolobus sp.]|uniref:hypothetical protein n=1 Tax=uncultured Methanolobus sp. TaxID=218300 RepID=UPI002AAAAD5E|nr:hypothetical protein [uncultured Methanolobus sp.]